ncbi:MAG: hypothetical protein KBD06_00540 [Candidatus Pacebacteria bacterium]|nr:hypothetical protein [Candidatus Paceibacterota bacterium]
MSERKVIVIAGPSGSGKNTLIKEITARFPNVATLTTVTTRIPRPHEVNGEDYYFYSIEDFDREVQKGYIKGERYVPLFGGVHYGIYVPDLEKKLATATAVLAPVDITGAEWLKKEYGALTIFITTESFDQYRLRLHNRSRDMSPKELDMRMKIAREEIGVHADKYDYRVVSAEGGLNELTERVLEIIKKEGYTL